MSDIVKDLLRKHGETKHCNNDCGSFLYVTNNLSHWLAASNQYALQGYQLISPGGAARYCGVSRQQIYSWCYISQKLTTFVCRPERHIGESYCLVDLDQALSLAALNSSRSGV